MKKKIVTIVQLIVLLVLSACTDSKEINNKEITSIDQYYELIETQKSYIYFYKEDCKYCNVFQPILEDLVEESSAEFYYYDIDENDKFEENSKIMEINGIGTVAKLVEYENGQVLSYVDHTNNRADISALLE